MVIAIREKPLKLLWLEAVMRRLLKNDVEFHYYQEQYRRLDAGFAGEQKVDREWHELLCPNTFSYYIICVSRTLLNICISLIHSLFALNLSSF